MTRLLNAIVSLSLIQTLLSLRQFWKAATVDPLTDVQLRRRGFGVSENREKDEKVAVNFFASRVRTNELLLNN